MTDGGTMTAEMAQAMAVAIRQWHAANRRCEQAGRVYAEAQLELQGAERDLHELARALEMLDPGVATVLVSQLVTAAGTVTVPVVPVDQAAVAAAAAAQGGKTASDIVLEMMQQGRVE